MKMNISGVWTPDGCPEETNTTAQIMPMPSPNAQGIIANDDEIDGPIRLDEEEHQDDNKCEEVRARDKTIAAGGSERRNRTSPLSSQSPPTIEISIISPTVRSKYRHHQHSEQVDGVVAAVASVTTEEMTLRTIR